MAVVIELRDLKKGLFRPVSCCWERSVHALCVLRVRVACVGLLGIALGYPLDDPRESALVSLCDVLTAAVSATFALLCDATNGVSALLSLPPIFGFARRLNLCFEEPLSPFDTCPTAAPFPAFSALRLCALGACALLLFGCSFGQREPAGRDTPR